LLAFFREDQIQTLSNRLTAGISNVDTGKVQAAFDVAISPEDGAAFEASRGPIVRHALGFLLQAESLDERQMMCLTYVGHERRYLEEEELDGLAEGFGKWLASRLERRFELLQEIRLFSRDPIERKLVIVRGVLVVEAGEPSQCLERRVDLLRAAQELAGRRISRARTLVVERLADLERGESVEDQAVARLVLEQAGALT
jgi:hypothetical protein